MTPEGRLRIEVVEQAGDWRGVCAGDTVERIAAAIGRRISGAAGDVALALADDATVRDLNRRFRGFDKPTNVLSFPSREQPAPGVHLGDIVLAVETLRAEAAADGKPAGDHFTHLCIHGILHLIGYDHESDDDAEAMERLETAILRDLGVANPYAEPALASNETG